MTSLMNSMKTDYELTAGESLAQIADRLALSEKIAIFAHTNPDGDAYASAIGMGLTLRSMGKEVKYLLGSSKQNFCAVTGESEVYEQSDFVPDKTYTALCVDCSTYEYAANNDKIALCKEIIVVDHHETNTLYGDMNYVDSTAAACAEIVYYLIKKMSCEITRQIADSLYLGIVTDTGIFAYSNTTKRTHLVVSELMDYGKDFHRIHDMLKVTSLTQFLARKEAMGNTDFYFGGQLGIMSLTKEDEVYSSNEIDTDGFIDSVRDVAGVRLAVFSKEIAENTHKVSLRSMDDNMGVSGFAAKNGGGGHPKAAGFTFSGEVDELCAMITEYFETEWME